MTKNTGTTTTYVWDNVQKKLVPQGSSRTVERERFKQTKLLTRIRQMFDADALKRICEMDEDEFTGTYARSWVLDTRPGPYNRYWFHNRGAKSRVLGVAHLDTVWNDRTCTVVNGPAGLMALSGALDDRLGAYVILDLLPKLGVKCDVLLTTGEECGQSTADIFAYDNSVSDHPVHKDYNWVFSFDRGGTDVVMYEYEDFDLRERVRDVGAHVGSGSFSDICRLEEMGVKGVNWGVGYRDYHGPRGHAWLEDTFDMVAKFVRFYSKNRETRLGHTPWRETYRTPKWWKGDGEYTPRKDGGLHSLGDAFAAGANSDHWDDLNSGDMECIREGYCPICLSQLDSQMWCVDCAKSWDIDTPLAVNGMGIDDDTGRIVDLGDALADGTDG